MLKRVKMRADLIAPYFSKGTIHMKLLDGKTEGTDVIVGGMGAAAGGLGAASIAALCAAGPFTGGVGFAAALALAWPAVKGARAIREWADAQEALNNRVAVPAESASRGQARREPAHGLNR